MTRFPEESCIGIDPPNTEEVRLAISQMSNGKAFGSNGVSGEVLK